MLDSDRVNGALAHARAVPPSHGYAVQRVYRSQNHEGLNWFGLIRFKYAKISEFFRRYLPYIPGTTGDTGLHQIRKTSR